MKNTNKFLIACLCLFVFALLGSQNANAQCTVVGIDQNFNPVSESISCNFPVYQKISEDEAVNDAAFAAAKETWYINYPKDYELVTSLLEYHYEITKSTFESMDNLKAMGLTESPELYVIVANPEQTESGSGLLLSPDVPSSTSK